MNKLLLIFIFGFLALTASATGVDTYTQNVLLNLHNIERSCIGLKNLTWDATIAATAQDWAEYLAENDEFKHSGEDVGENIAEASIRDNMAAFMFSLWADEKEHFSNAKPYPHVSTDGKTVGHYTQLIWGATNSVGCGVANTTSMSYLVCQYKPAGNYKNNYVYTTSDIVNTPNCNPGASQTSTGSTSSSDSSSSTDSSSSSSSTGSSSSSSSSSSTTTKVTTTTSTPTHSTTYTNTTISITPTQSTASASASTNTTVSITPTQSTTSTNTTTTVSINPIQSSSSTNTTTSNTSATCTTPEIPSCVTSAASTHTTPNSTQPTLPNRPIKSRGKGKKGKRRVLKVVVDMTKKFDDVEIVLRI